MLECGLYGVHKRRRDYGSSFMWHQPCQRFKFTTSVDTHCGRQIFVTTDSILPYIILTKRQALPENYSFTIVTDSVSDTHNTDESRSKLTSPLLRTHSWQINVQFLKPGVSQNIAIHASPIACCFPPCPDFCLPAGPFLIRLHFFLSLKSSAICHVFKLP